MTAPPLPITPPAFPAGQRILKIVSPAEGFGGGGGGGGAECSGAWGWGWGCWRLNENGGSIFLAEFELRRFSKAGEIAREGFMTL